MGITGYSLSPGGGWSPGAGAGWPGLSRKLSRMGPETTMTELGAARFVAAVDKMLAVYMAAMNPAPSQLSGRRSIMARHATNPGFRALTVLDEGGEPVAFRYRFHRQPAPWGQH